MLRYIICLALLAGCCPVPPNWDRSGLREFACDSCLIREGKSAILSMGGVDMGAIAPEMLVEYDDAIMDGDILEIAIYHPSRRDLSQAVDYVSKSVGYTIQDGRVLLPDLEPVQVGGLSLPEAQRKIQEAYQDEIRDVNAFVSYRDRTTHKVDLIGMVSASTLPVDGQVRLYEILSKARVPDRANLFMSYVLRDGRPLPIDLYKLVHQGDLTQNIVMRGGDKIFIAAPAESTVMVMGEVGRPQAIPIPNGYISLREAIVTAGGIPYTGDRRFIQVIRGNVECPRIYLLNWDQLLHVRNDYLLLMPGDTVYVSPKPITKWNRFISQLFPSFQGVQQAYSTTTITPLAG